MSAGIWFWIIYVICLLFGVYLTHNNFTFLGGSLVIFILVGLLGWQVFGPPIKRQ